jgi:hypothetical protein
MNNQPLPLNKESIKEIDNESLLTNGKETFSLEDLRHIFTARRRHDDEFARDYAVHEFVDYLNNEGYALV